MGNKQSNQPSLDVNSGSLVTPIQPPPISRSSFQLFLQCLYKLPFTLTENQFEDVVYDLKERTVQNGSVILQEGLNAIGIFVIINGCCNVIASDGVTVLSQLQNEDVFGEISSLYNTPCTCTVSVTEDNPCELVFLEVQKIKEMIQVNNNVFPMRTWFIEKRYIDCVCLFSTNEISKEVIKMSMSQTALFHNWSPAALSYVYDNLPKHNIDIYQPGVCLSFEGDKEICAIILLKGTVELLKDGKLVASLSSTDECVCFRDESLFIDTQQMFTIKSVTTCQAVVFTNEHFEFIHERYPIENAKLMDLSQRWHSYYENLNMSIVICNPLLSSTLKTNLIFSLAPNAYIHLLVMGMMYRVIDENNVILEYNEEYINNKIIVVLLKGSADVVNGTKTHKELHKGDLFYFHSKFIIGSNVTASESCVVGYISNDLIKDLKNDNFSDTVLNLNW